MSTRVTLASPAQAAPRIVTSRDDEELSVGCAITDFTPRVVIEWVFSGFTSPPGTMISFGMRYPGFMKLPSYSLSETWISVSHLQEAAPIHPGTKARAG